MLIAVTSNKQVVSEEGLTVITDYTIEDPLLLDVLLVTSAYKMENLLSNQALIHYIKQHGKTTTWMDSNCSGAFLLAEAGILNGKKATTWAGGEKGLAKSCPLVDVQIDQNVVMDTNVVTSNGGPVSYQAAFALLAQLSSAAKCQERPKL